MEYTLSRPYPSSIITVKGEPLTVANNVVLHVVQCAISIILECVFFLPYFILLPGKVLNRSVMSSYIGAMP